MSEVHRYKVVVMLSGTDKITYKPHGPEVVTAEAYDALRTEFETFKADRLKASEEILEATAAHSNKVDALQDLLNERDQQLDGALTLLRWVSRNTFSYRVIKKVDAFLSQPETKQNAQP